MPSQSTKHSFHYDDTTIHLEYDSGRELHDDVVGMWMHAMSSKVDRNKIEYILDLGCGTGRFSEKLSRHFGARVHGIDPSENMLRRAIESGRKSRCQFSLGCAEHIPLGDGEADLVFMSMTYHHIECIESATNEILRVLKNGGYLCIRNATIECMESYLWLKYFPTAHEIESARLPRAYDVLEHFKCKGFDVVFHGALRQQFAASLEEYVKKIGLRTLSALERVSDEEFFAGMQRMKQSIGKSSRAEAIFEDIYLFVFRIQPKQPGTNIERAF